MYLDIIDTLLSNDYYSLKKDINKLISDSTFVQNIIRVHNPIAFDRFVKMCEYKIDTSLIFEERNKFIKKVINKLNEDNICEFFEVDNKIVANRFLIEYIICYYFGDNYYNFLTNFHLMVNYLRHGKSDLVDNKNLEIYQEFIDLKDLSVYGKIDIFEKFLDTDIMGLFYDDMNRVREDSHKELVDKGLKLNHENGIYNKDISNRLGVDVYILDGEEFYGFVRCLTFPSSDLTKGNFVFAKGKRLGYSFSYIGDKNIGTLGIGGLTLFYDNIDYRKIMYVHHADAHTKLMNTQDDYLSEKENEILLPETLISKTKSYNEIYIKGDSEGIKPSAIVCFDKITNADIDFAKQYNLAILVINKEKYMSYDIIDDDYDINTYVI